ncbi:MAG: hypothetical protein ABI947_04830 [Chloroflexota bacterium]
MTILHRRRFRRLVFAVLFVALLIFGCLGSEIAARLWLNSVLTVPLPDDVALTSATDLRDLTELAKGWRLDANGEWNVTFHSEHYNFTNGLRETIGQRGHWINTIYMFGSSTMVDMQVADRDTKPSILQNLLNADGYQYRVVNASSIGFTTGQSLRRLNQIALVPGDIVIFYDGAHEFAHIGTIALRASTLTGRLCSWMRDTYSTLALSTVYCIATDILLPSAAATTEALTESRQQYITDLLAASAYARVHGATFYHFLQPNIFSAPLSRYEQHLIFVESLDYPNAPAALIASWPSIRSVVPELQRNGVASVDLYHVLDAARAAELTVYIDSWHTTAQANRIITRAIYDTISPF